MRIEQRGNESARLSNDGGFVVVRIHVGIIGELPTGGARLRYTVGSFAGRETDVSARVPQAKLTLRVPKEIFRSGDRLAAQVFFMGDEGQENIVWSAQYETAWSGDVPHLQPVAG